MPWVREDGEDVEISADEAALYPGGLPAWGDDDEDDRDGSDG